MAFIIDFDDTLMDIQAYKQSRIDALGKLGVSKEIYVETYKQAYYTYTHELHAKLIANRGFDYEAVYGQLEKCLDEVGSFIFPDTISFLESLKSYGTPMILLSFGVGAIQERKLRAVQLHKYFDRIYTSVEPKEKVILQFANMIDKDTWFINDKVEETKHIHQSFPMLRVVLKQCPAYPEEEYQSSGFPYFKTLTEIQQYVAERIE